MQPARQVIREFRWKEIFPAIMLVRVFRCSIRIHALVLSLIATILIFQGWQISARLLLPQDHHIRQAMELGASAPPFAPSTPGAASLTGFFDSSALFNPFLFEFRRFAVPVQRLFSRCETYEERGYYLIGFTWTLLVGGFFAGVICRTAAFDLASHERYGVFRALRFVALKFRSFFTAPLIPLLVLSVMLLPIFVLGLAAAYVSPLLVSLLWGFALLWGVLLGVVAIVALFSWPLIWPALAAEDSDSFDALGSSIGYVSQRPFSYFIYVTLAAIVTAAGFLVVSWILQIGASLTQFAMITGGGLETAGQFVGAANAHPESMTASVYNFWSYFSSYFLEAYLFSAFWTAATGVLLLLRYDVDGAELDDIYRDGAEDEKPMPKLAREMGLTGEAASMTAPVAPPAEAAPAKAD